MNTKVKEGTIIEGELVREPMKKAEKKLPAAAVKKEVGELQAVTPMAMLSMAINKGTDLAQLEKLMELQERWEKNEAKKAFDRAVSAFKANPPVLHKNKTVNYQNKDNSMTSYDHATLDHLCEAICPELSKHGLSHRWDTMQGEGGAITVTCVLTHEMGHSQGVPLKSLPDQSGGKNAIQSIGSTVTYLQRYTLLAVTGLAVGVQDDDGAAANKRPGDEPADTQPKAAAAPEVVMYPVEKYTELLPSWKAMVATGEKDPEKLIRQVETKGKLTEEQKKAIRDAKFPESIPQVQA